MSTHFHTATAEMKRSDYEQLRVREEDPIRIFGTVELPVELLEADTADQQLQVQRAVQDLATRLLWHLGQPESRRPRKLAPGPFGELERSA